VTGQQVVAQGLPSSSIPITLAADAPGGAARTAMMLLAVALLFGIALAPPLISRLMERDRR
jgi:hypothetical protein